MFNYYARFFIRIIALCAATATVKATPFDLVTPQTKVSIVYAADDLKLDSIAAYLLAGDIERVTGYIPKVFTDVSQAGGNVIMIGTLHSKLISSLHDAYFEQLNNKWECYSLKVIPHPFKNIQNALVITGSDIRGTAYGVFDISTKAGVTPWYWWADAAPEQRKTLSINIDAYTSLPPSVKYRGIFINDEDWGLQPWAAKTFEPETGDIGPKTYAKVFELLLRLKANLIWPAMHPSTKAFFSYPGNIKTAEDYQIVIGSSHAEPMLRNNVGEWNEKTMGAFNYIINKQKVSDYWELRVKESSRINAIYTIGMRGVHDSGIEGVKTIPETVPLVERIFGDQRDMLKKYVNPDITKVPQAFTAYKEVLDVYDAGLKLPDDVTLVWPDDNYGYIQRLYDDKEKNRTGGSGVYYHVSYWGRPHDYIWLSTTSPGLIREEMTKAYDMDARNIWVVNVGDIKPAEYNIQLFMDMAYRIQPFYNSSYVKGHLAHWVADNIGSKNAGTITDVLWKYYQLAFERKPEFMGWSQTEPTTQVKMTEYNHQYYGDQAQQRIDAYTKLENDVKAIRNNVAPDKQSSYYQLVYYPVVASSQMNKKFLYRDKAYLFAQEGRLSAQYYANLSNDAYDNIIKETKYYNTYLSSGKWAGIMSMEPRELPVFLKPDINLNINKQSSAWQVIPEGHTGKDEVPENLQLPVFNCTVNQKHFVDIFLTKDTTINYTIKTSAPCIRVSQYAGKLTAQGNQSQNRIWLDIDWTKVPVNKPVAGQITISAGNKNISINVKADQAHYNVLKDFKGAVAVNGYVSIYAKNYQQSTTLGDQHWAEITGLGATGSSVEALPLIFKLVKDLKLSDANIKKMPALSYAFFTPNASPAEIKVYTMPTYPLNKNFEMRYAIAVDDGPATVVNFRTVGRSEEWKQDVLSNAAMRSVKVASLPAGKHTLHIYMIDPGVILDRMLIDLGGLKPLYGLLPETKGN